MADNIRIPEELTIEFIDSLSGLDAEDVCRVMQDIDDAKLYKIKGLSQFRKLDLLNIKYGRRIIADASLEGAKYMHEGVAVLNLRGGNILNVMSCRELAGRLVIEGTIRLSAAERPYTLYAEDSKGGRHIAEIMPYRPAGRKGLRGDDIVKGERFRIEIPCAAGTELSFMADLDGTAVRLKPNYDSGLELGKKGYMMASGCIVTASGDRIETVADGFLRRHSLERKFHKEYAEKHGKTALQELRDEEAFADKCRKARIEDRVAFITVRSTDNLLGNMEKVWDAVDLPKVSLARLRMHEDPECVRKCRELIATSRVVVTDDYLFPLRTMDKKPGQHFVQLWHATGAGKQFGKDGSTAFPAADALYHKDYDLVTVSAEGIRGIYASAFSISDDKVEATGVARTDDFFDPEYIESAKARIREAHPELQGKRIILYTPTFRDLPGIPRSRFEPELDFGRLAEVIGDEAVLAVCPHPVMTEPVVRGEYGNIVEIRDIPTNDMMFVSDMMITDYSSTMFEYSLFHKPIAFFCYDYDTYDRDFYMDFEKELPGPLLRSQEELFAYLEQGDYPLMEDSEAFREKYMGACDGHSAERIAARIADLFHDKEGI